MLLDLGNEKGVFDECLCDMSRVLITHIGFVAIVLLAPAMMDDQKLITWGLSVIEHTLIHRLECGRVP